MDNSLNFSKANQYIPKLNYSMRFDPVMAENASEKGVEEWNDQNRDISIAFRQSHDFLRVIYSLADSFLEAKLGKEYSLPIDVRALAEKCNFVIRFKDFGDLREKRKDHTFSPVAQLQMRGKRTKEDTKKIVGTINVADYLGETSIRFSIAHELAHYVLRKHNPIGLNYLHEVCPGMYPLSDSDELLSDLFAYAILLPYNLFLEIKDEYENNNSRWPIDFSDWISYLRDKTQMPDYHVVLAYQSIKQYTIALRLAAAREKSIPWLNEIIKYLTGKKFSKSEIKEILSYQGAKGEAKEIQERLAETIDVIQDELRSLAAAEEKGSGQIPNQSEDSIEITEGQNSAEKLSSDSSAETIFKEWKESIINKLFILGMTGVELRDIAGKIDISDEYVTKLMYDESETMRAAAIDS